MLDLPSLPYIETLPQAILDIRGEPTRSAKCDFPYESIEEFVALPATIKVLDISTYASTTPPIEDENTPAAVLKAYSVETCYTGYLDVLRTIDPFPNAFDPACTVKEVRESPPSTSPVTEAK